MHGLLEFSIRSFDLMAPLKRKKIEVVQSLSRKNVIDAYDSDFTCHKFTVSSFLEY